MTGEDDEQPRRVTYAELAGLIRRTANLFVRLGGERVELLPGTSVTEHELRSFAESEISERPAWPNETHPDRRRDAHDRRRQDLQAGAA